MRNRWVAACLAILLGGLGLHKLYLGKYVQAAIYFLLCGTGIPTILGIIEGIWYITMSDTEFLYRYG